MTAKLGAKLTAGVKRAPGWLRLWLVLAIMAFLPLISSFLTNRYQISVLDLILPALMALVIAATVAAGFYWLWRRDRLAGYVAGLITVFIIGWGYDHRLDAVFGKIHGLVPWLDVIGYSGTLASGLLLGGIGVGAYLAGRLVSGAVRRLGWRDREVVPALMIGLLVTFGLQAGALARDLILEWPQFFYQPPRLNAATSPAAKTSAKPDIYYIVLDRYASEDVLKNQFQFDNADFLSFLSSQGYYSNPAAHNNYPFTSMSVASTMQADYLNDVIQKFGESKAQTTVAFDEIVRNSPVAQELKTIGYRYELIGNWYETSNLSRLADTTFQQTGRLSLLGHEITLNNFSKDVLTQSPFWRFIQPGMRIGNFQVFGYTNFGDVDMTHYALKSLRDEAVKPGGGRFIFAHILVPHDPYYFKADGSLRADTGSNNNGAPVKQKYLGQVQYINTQIKAILSTIQASSNGQAIVVLQADEGPYPNQLNDGVFDEEKVKGELLEGDMRRWPDANLQMKLGNLAAYYMPKVDWATQAGQADSVNVFRLLFNTYFGGTMPYRPDCYYVYPNGRDKPMVFADVTARLSGQPADERCGEDGTAGL